MAFNILGSDLFLSPKEKKAKQDAYFNKMYPLGTSQQKYEDEIFPKLFNDPKKIPTYRYVSFIRREMYIDGIEQEESTLKRYKKTLKHMKIDEEEAGLIESLVKLEYKAKTIKELPDVDTIIKNK